MNTDFKNIKKYFDEESERAGERDAESDEANRKNKSLGYCTAA